MSDNITLPRAVVEQVREALLSFDNWWDDEADTALAALNAALAEPEQKPEPVAWMYVNSEGECEQIEYETPPAGDDSITPLYAAPPEPDAIARAVEAEREACRQACKALADAAQEEAYYRAHMECEAAIRARGSK